MAWDDTREAELAKLWAEGLSASKIAQRMTTGDFEPTRNAIIAKVHRLRLPRRRMGNGNMSRLERQAQSERRKERHRKKAEANAPKSIPKAQAALRKIFSAPLEPIDAVEELFIPHAERKTLLQLGDKDCRWPIGDPRQDDFHFCGKVKIEGLPYCEHHSKRAFLPPKQPSRSPTPVRSLRIVAGTEFEAEGGTGSGQERIATGGLRKAKETV